MQTAATAVKQSCLKRQNIKYSKVVCYLGQQEVLLKHGMSSSLQLHVAGLGEVYKMQQPRKRGQWLVQARFDGLLTIMTPIWPDKENLALLLNQVRSLSLAFLG